METENDLYDQYHYHYELLEFHRKMCRDIRKKLKERDMQTWRTL